MSTKSNVDNNGLVINEMHGIISVSNNFSLSDLRPYIEEVVASELEKYKNQAFVTAKQRDDEFVVSVFNKLNQLDTKIDKVREAFSQPAMQYDLLEAEKGYIKTGSKSLLDILGELIAERIASDETTLSQIVLSEAIKTAPVLLDKHLDILAIRFILAHCSISGIRTIDELGSFLSRYLLPFCSKSVFVDRLDFEHLDFTRCSINGIASKPLNLLIWEKFTSAFYIPFKDSVVKGSEINGKNLLEWFPDAFVGVESGLLSFKEQSFLNFSNSINHQKDIPEFVKKNMLDFYKRHTLDENKIEEYLFSERPNLLQVKEMWDKGVSHINLSSVGIAIGAIHVKNRTDLNIDLKIWIH